MTVVTAMPFPTVAAPPLPHSLSGPLVMKSLKMISTPSYSLMILLWTNLVMKR